MPQIILLDPHVANLIAAGEVVERPASVVKELMENAVDAGATQITVEIQHGGMAQIRVTDNGSGIPAQEAEVAFRRHATSKLRAAQDLEAIGTLGFRGEALAAIAAVSRVQLFTRTAEASLGISLSLEGGEVVEQEEAGCPVGTTMVVRDLFFNTPARLKFMKRDAAEGAAVFAIVQRVALSHPEVSVKFLREGKQELLTPGDGLLQSTLYSVMGRDMALGFLPVEGTGEGVTVTGFVSHPTCCRGTRGYQHFFVNGRQIRSRLLMAALEEAYQNQKMVGKFPGCVLHVALKPNKVDVNVHPAKTEVKFVNERQVFHGVYYAVLSALTGNLQQPVMQMIPPTPPAAIPDPKQPGNWIAPGKNGVLILRQDTQQGLSRLPIEREPSRKEMPKTQLSWLPAKEAPTKTPITEEEAAPVFASHVSPQTKHVSVAKAQPEVETISHQEENPEPSPLPSPITIEKQESSAPWRLVGEVFHTYLIVEQGDTVYLIDKHAAHERMQFDRMKEQNYQPMAQALVTPLVLTPTPEEYAILTEQFPLLTAFGFDVDDFGGGALVVRQIPFDLQPGDTEGALGEIAQALLSVGQINPDSARDCVLHTMACKSAIKGGQKNDPQELLVVAEAVLSGQVKFCPHGRPVSVTLPKGQLERQFKRS